MSEQYPGGFITKSPPTPQGSYDTSSAYGIWNLSQQAGYQKQGLWPVPGNQQPDAQFNYVTMLLHGDGTNGAQNNTFLDSSTNNFTITRNGNTTQGSFSPYGSNLYTYFPGPTSGHFTVSPVLSSTGDFTLECWANVADLATDYCISSGQYLSSTPGPNCQLMIYSTGEVYFYMNGFAITTSGAAITPNTWVHIAAVRSGTTITIYVNGVSKGSGTSSGTYDVYCLGAFWFDSNAGAYQEFKGYLSNLRLTNTAVYTSGFTPSTTPLTAISGTRLLTFQNVYWKDNSTNNYTVSPYGGVAIQRYNLSPFTPYSTLTAYSTATIGGSGYFDGSGDYLSTTGSYSLSGNFTVEGWMYATANGARPFGKGDVALTSGISCYCTTTTFEVTLGTSATITPTYPILNQWIHYAVVRSGTTCTLYLNGVSQGTATYSGTVSGTTFVGAAYYASTVYAGSAAYISDYRISNTADYSGNFTPPTSPITAASGTQFLCNMTNAAIYDNAMMNDLQTANTAQISTSVKKYGTGSIYFPASTDRLVPAYTNSICFALGAGDFTIEGWMYMPTISGSGYGGIMGSGASAAQFTLTCGTTGYAGTDNKLNFNPGSDSVLTSTTTVTNSAWHHFAVVRVGSSYKMFIDGVLEATGAATAIDFKQWGSDTYVGVGQCYHLAQPGTYLDDIRITKGYARYTTNFTPPTAAFPNIGPT